MGAAPSIQLARRSERRAEFGLRESAECERKSLHTRIEKLNLELPVSDGLRLSDQLIQPLFGNLAGALIVNVNSVSGARRLSVNERAKSHGTASRRRPHD